MRPAPEHVRHRRIPWSSSVQRRLSERRRTTASAVVAACTTAVLLGLDARASSIPAADVGVLVLFACLLPYLVLTLVTFSTVPDERVRLWARRESRGTWTQRYVFGTAPGPGVSIFIAAAALVVAVVWLPGHLGSAFLVVPRVAVALGLVVTAWVCVVASFAVTFQADNLVEDERALDFPGGRSAAWADYVHFAPTLTCEVFDASSTAPHLRRARTFDEGGRGLLLVAQLADRWGTRHGREGKVIWAEQALPAERTS
ncbi:ATP-binding protein [Streptomyces sp. NPDC101165]|uniref:ATP-binding protein n=1 Tax=Streptomyces sp. NPDC101165 TaxID=3366119 RepID=UPI003806CC6F